MIMLSLQQLRTIQKRLSPELRYKDGKNEKNEYGDGL